MGKDSGLGACTIAGMREGETGWLSAACDAAGLAAIMHQVIERHTAEIEAIYREAMDGICRAA